jgi:predicted lysophospholipase L1 biosynthesis ABC-type transport system permease subunit
MSQPTRRDRYRPVEFIGLAFAIALVGALVVLMSSRDLKFALIVLGISFVAALVLIAMFVLAMKPNKEEINDIEEMSAEDKH